MEQPQYNREQLIEKYHVSCILQSETKKERKIQVSTN